ncbi:alanine acetyltransferase [Loigolactobacillus jiayinensis]|uniref:Alanine acetyltransferase n=1 Tax=Loigolactobacillus jiayinensis TaxID=2486016 RepID=A0ABW1RBZ5_9LACO|nr:alanine acetyltransferase [Loigolactobacillus jiayinensis]
MKFEHYHPMMSANYTLDWLTHTPLKTVHDNIPTQRSMTEMAQVVSQAMQLIMHNQALIWGIVQRADQQFCGIASLTVIPAKQQAELKFIYHPERLTTAARAEIIDYLAAFTFAELDLKHFAVSLSGDDTTLRQKLLTQHYLSTKQPQKLIKNK